METNFLCKPTRTGCGSTPYVSRVKAFLIKATSASLGVKPLPDKNEHRVKLLISTHTFVPPPFTPRNRHVMNLFKLVFPMSSNEHITIKNLNSHMLIMAS